MVTVRQLVPPSTGLGRAAAAIRRRAAPREVAKEVSLVDVEFEPAAVGTAETKVLCNVKKGDVVLSAHARKLVLAAASSTTTLSVGDGDDLQRFIPQTDTETGTAGDIVPPASYSPPAFPYVYPADDTIDIDYATVDTPGATAPRWRVVIHLILADYFDGSLHMEGI